MAYENEIYEGFMDGIKHVENSQKLSQALAYIVWYDGHEEWLEKLAGDLEKATGNYVCPFKSEQWHTEHHVIWMLLVGMFGDWGTSIRGGWIKDTKEAAWFIKDLLKRAKGDLPDEDAENNAP